MPTKVDNRRDQIFGRDANAASLPRPTFKNWEDVERVRNFMLGLPVKNKARLVPWGYKVSEKDPAWLEPIEDQIHLLAMAKTHLRSYPIREVTAWIVEKSGRYLTHQALWNIMSTRCPDDRCLLPLKERWESLRDTLCLTISWIDQEVKATEQKRN